MTSLQSIIQNMTSEPRFSAVVGTLTGLAHRAVAKTVPASYGADVLCTLSRGVSPTISTFLATPLRYAAGVLAVSANGLLQLFQAPLNPDKAKAAQARISALVFGIMPSLLTATGMLPSWLTSDLARQSLYAHSIHEATNAIAYGGRFLALRTATILSTTLFGIANFIFFTQRTEGCQSIESTYRDIGGALLATGLGWLANRIITPLFHRQPSQQSSRETSGPYLSKRKSPLISPTEPGPSSALTIPSERQSILDDLRQQPVVNVHYEGHLFTLLWNNKTVPIYLPSHIKRLLNLSEGNHRFTPKDLLSGLHQLQAAARGPHLSLPGSSNATQIVPAITPSDIEMVLALAQPTEELSAADRVTLEFLAKIALGDTNACCNFVYAFNSVFGREELADVSPFDHLRKMYYGGSDFHKIHILQLLTLFLSTKASLPADTLASASLKLEMDLLLAQIQTFQGEHARTLSNLHRNLNKQIERTWPSSSQASSSSQAQELSVQLAPIQFEALLTQLEELSKDYPLKSDTLYNDIAAYLHNAIAEIDLSELDRAEENKPTLSAYASRFNVVCEAITQLVLLSKKPMIAFQKAFNAFTLSQKMGTFGVSVALSGALQANPVNRLKLATDDQDRQLTAVAILAGNPAGGVKHMHELKQKGSSSLPNVSTLLSAVEFAKQKNPLTSDGEICLPRIENRMQAICVAKLLLVNPPEKSRKPQQPSPRFTAIINGLSDAKRRFAQGLVIQEQQPASSSTQKETPDDFIERIFRIWSARTRAYPQKLVELD